ncbi:MAG: leucine-rich repeat domain-containing protein [Aeriscardovia sp.]|nr:leucine-rich repeat domain-containing protein [Aeriscardovia sp.]
MKLHYCVILIFVISIAFTKAYAHDFMVVNDDGVSLYYSFVMNHNSVAVSYKGNYYGSFNNVYSGHIHIPDSVTYNNCSYQVTAIGEYAFYNCSAITGIEIPSGITYIGTSAFEGCVNLKSIEIPNMVTSIGGYAFKGCLALKELTIPDNVTRLGDSMMLGCQHLISVIIGNGITHVNNYAFQDCIRLKSIVLGEKVNYIDIDAFNGCMEIESIYCHSNDIPTLHYAFDVLSPIYNKAIIYVPSNMTERYRQRNSWALFKNIVVMEKGVK